MTKPQVRWRFDAGTALTLGPVAAGDMVLVTDAEGVLYALDAASGNELWRHRHDEAAAGIVATERCVFVDSGGDLWPHDRLTGRIADEAFGDVGGRPVQAAGEFLLFQDGSVLGAADLATASLLFSTGKEVLHAPVAVAGDVIVAADVWEGNSAAGGLHGFDASTGRTIWSVESGADEDDPFSIPPFHPVIAHGLAWVTAGRPSSWEDEEEWCRCELVGYRPDSGEIAFSQVVGPARMGVPCCAVAAMGDLVFVVTAQAGGAGEYITAFEADEPVERVELHAVDVTRSEVVWTRPISGLPVGAPVVSDGLVHTLTRDGSVLACDAMTGADAWTFTADEPPGESVEREWGEGVTEEPPRLLPGDGVLFVQTATTLLAVDSSG
ncbi:PQQ-binding-like beta-propeller repeat protein [Actinomadura sp. 9N407]|uniref:outer membrane protein assembly factor BamB family protein n=1 Tax=Actinomadura sp. 9N407 TaxID=3375154 RepID=UPI0037B06CE4